MAAKKRTARLGRGLSSLMAQPAPVMPTTDQATGSAAAAEAPEQKPARKKKLEPKNGQAKPQVTDVEETGKQAIDQQVASGDGLQYLAVVALRANPHQPRQYFDEAALQGLAASIKADGLMQPIVVRPVSDSVDGADYDIVAGERRWRAAKLAGLETVPAIVRELDDRQLAEWALIENLQREDLNPIERAQAFRRLIDQFALSHEEIARRVGVDRSSISNLLRLLNLCDDVQTLIHEGRLSMGQARAIAGLSDVDKQKALAEQAVRQGLSVRQVEQLVKRANLDESEKEEAINRKRVRSAYLADLEQQLAEQLQTKVKVRPGRKKGSGTLAIEFYSLDQFDDLLGKLGVTTE